MGQHDPAPLRRHRLGGYAIMYRVVDYMGRKSEPTYVGIQVGFGYQGSNGNLC